MNIGLIAMSGVRAFNKELMEFGFTLPGFVERAKVIASLPSLSLLTLAGLTPKRFGVQYHEIADLRATPELPDSFDLVAISSYTAQIRDAYEVALRYRERGTKVVMGGLHVSVLPEEALQYCDAVVVGEAEPVWGTLLEDFERDRLRRVYSARGQEFDLADAPMPRFELLDISKYNRLTVQTQRGCPWHCEFCGSGKLLTSKYKQKPVAKVIDEIRRIKELWPEPFIEFADDNTFVNKAHAKELMRALAREGVRWFTETDISVAEDEDLLRLMHDAGCAQILVGLESPVSAGLDGLELKRNWKLQQLDHYKRAIATIQGHGITVNGCFILGLDGQGPEVFDAVWEFVRDSGLYEVQITVLTAFPGTPLYARLLREERLLEPTAWERCTLFDVNFRPSGMSVAEMERGFRELGQRLYSAEFTQQRKAAFYERRGAAWPEGA
ncbi:MAG TPA: radical SAM protein [Dehalococcoidia bacterium]|nr:radical SAM protein [Dehalococcoidia bacterium]